MYRHLGFCLAAFGIGLATYPVLTAQTPARRVIHPAKFPETGLPYSPGIMVGDTLYLAGQLGRDPATTKIVPGGIEAETRQTAHQPSRGASRGRGCLVAQPGRTGGAADDHGQDDVRKTRGAFSKIVK